MNTNYQWWRSGVIYQIYPRSFRDSSGDGKGDLPGITSKLDYVAGLGVDAIWISPFMKSPMKDFGYDVSDYHDVDPVFGTLEDFDALILNNQKGWDGAVRVGGPRHEGQPHGQPHGQSHGQPHGQRRSPRGGPRPRYNVSWRARLRI